LGIVKSLETLAIRLDRRCENALKVAEFRTASNVNRVKKYPFLNRIHNMKLQKQMKFSGSIVAFEIKVSIGSRKSFWIK
jgi:O-succinylhomoserine sulfhydrylase